MKSYNIGFLHHSGFYVELSDSILVFDYYRDPEKILDKVVGESDKPLYFFVSHLHYDHFNPDIARFKERTTEYILHKDCDFHMDDMSCVHFMDAGEDYETAHFHVHMYGSTDAGGSYWITHPDLTLFHAGDLNWWHWDGEPYVNNRAARMMFFSELNKFKENNVDLLFFPVDARQEVAREWGIHEFMEKIKVNKLFVPMHAFGERWKPSKSFYWRYLTTPLWIPEKDGDVYKGEL